MEYYSFADIAEFKRGRDKKKRDPRDDKGKKRFIKNLALATGASALLTAPFFLADRAATASTNKDVAADTSYKPLNDEQKKVLRGLGVDLRTPGEIKAQEDAARKAFQEDLAKDGDRYAAYQRNKPAIGRSNLQIDDKDVYEKYKNKKAAVGVRAQNFKRIMLGSEGMDLATDVTALNNKNLRKSMSKVDRKALIQKVAGRLNMLRKVGRFNGDYYHLADFSTNANFSANAYFSRKPGDKDKFPGSRKRKKPQLLGERLTTKVRKGAIPGAALGGIGGLMLSGGNLRQTAKSTLAGAGVGAGFGGLTWGLGARSPIPAVRNWQRNRNKR